MKWTCPTGHVFCIFCSQLLLFKLQIWVLLLFSCQNNQRNYDDNQLLFVYQVLLLLFSLMQAQTSYKPHTLMNILLFTRELTDNYKPVYIIWTLCGGALLVAILKDLFMSPSGQST